METMYIDLNNRKQVRWWNKIASKLVKTVYYETVVETATGKSVGVILMTKGLLSKIVSDMNVKKFIENPVTLQKKFEL